MSQQQAVSLPSNSEQDDQEVVEEKRETRAFFFQYMSTRAQKDGDLRASDAELIQQQGKEVVQVMSDDTANAATMLGLKLADLGDELDASVQEIVELSGTPETAFSIFFDVVKNLFEIDEQGRAQITLGRIAALLAYCYQLCKTYIIQKMAPSTLIISFMGMVAGWLFQFFLKVKFYEWLHSQGGWGQLIRSATMSITRLGWNVVLVVGVAYLVFQAISYLRRSS